MMHIREQSPFPFGQGMPSPFMPGMGFSPQLPYGMPSSYGSMPMKQDPWHNPGQFKHEQAPSYPKMQTPVVLEAILESGLRKKEIEKREQGLQLEQQRKSEKEKNQLETLKSYCNKIIPSKASKYEEVKESNSEDGDLEHQKRDKKESNHDKRKAIKAQEDQSGSEDNESGEEIEDNFMNAGQYNMFGGPGGSIMRPSPFPPHFSGHPSGFFNDYPQHPHSPMFSMYGNTPFPGHGHHPYMPSPYMHPPLGPFPEGHPESIQQQEYIQF